MDKRKFLKTLPFGLFAIPAIAKTAYKEEPKQSTGLQIKPSECMSKDRSETMMFIDKNGKEVGGFDWSDGELKIFGNVKIDVEDRPVAVENESDSDGTTITLGEPANTWCITDTSGTANIANWSNHFMASGSCSGTI